jgi:hypothetical protein
MSEPKSFMIICEYWDTPIHDSQSVPPRFMQSVSYILTHELPAPGKEVKALFHLYDKIGSNKIVDGVKLKVPNNAQIREISFDDFQRVFKTYGGTIEEENR